MRHETSRLLIREIEMADWPSVHRYAKELDIMKYVIYRANNTETETKDFIHQAMNQAQQTPRTIYERAVGLRDKPEILIGGCGISLANQTNREWMTGYCYHSDYWGQGYGTEVCRALLTFGFTDLEAHRISAVCDADNPGSLRVLEKSGMRLEGCFREKVWGLGQWRDELQYAILDYEWQATQFDQPVNQG